MFSSSDDVKKGGVPTTLIIHEIKIDKIIPFSLAKTVD